MVMYANPRGFAPDPRIFMETEMGFGFFLLKISPPEALKTFYATEYPKRTEGDV